LPSPIVHLEVLFVLFNQFNRTVTAELLLGVLSPDAIHMRPNQTWLDKAMTHFYHEADTSYDHAIKTAKKIVTDESDDFQLGYLIHLYTDYLWREKIYTPFFNAYKDRMERSELHALYYFEMQCIDHQLLSSAYWVEEARLKLLQVKSLACLPLLSKNEIDDWRLKVLEDDLKRKAYQQNECKVFNMRQIQSFIAFCCNQLTQQLEGWKTSESC